MSVDAFMMWQRPPDDLAEPSAGPRVLIVDDEPLARDCIRIALATTDARIVGECGDGNAAVDAIRRLAPDVVFLDVQMPELDGFGVIQEIGPGRMPVTVFVTAFDAHAVRAFEVHAFDYVLKPFDDARLISALDHARLVLLDRRHSQLGRRLAELVATWQLPASDATPEPADGASVRVDTGRTEVAQLPVQAGAPPAYITRFTVRETGRARFIAASAVDWIGASRNYLVLHVGEHTFRVRGALQDVMARLNPRLFARVHKSTIVNIERIRELQPWFGGDYVAILRTGVQLKVSRRYVAQLLKPMA